MIARYFGILLTAATIVGGVDAGTDQQGDKEKLQGEWNLSSIRFGENQKPGTAQVKLEIKGDVWKLSAKGKGPEFFFTIDTTKNPKQLTLEKTVGDMRVTFSGIYKLEGDTLTFCRTKIADGERPKDFKPSVNSMLLTFQRVLKEDDLANFQGEWEGKAVFPKEGAKIQKVINGNRGKVTYFDNEGNKRRVHTSEFKVQKSEDAYVFTFWNLEVIEGDGKGNVIKGPISYLYRLEGNKMYEIHGFHHSRPGRMPSLIIWTKTKSTKE